MDISPLPLQSPPPKALFIPKIPRRYFIGFLSLVASLGIITTTLFQIRHTQDNRSRATVATAPGTIDILFNPPRITGIPNNVYQTTIQSSPIPGRFISAVDLYLSNASTIVGANAANDYSLLKIDYLPNNTARVFIVKYDVNDQDPATTTTNPVSLATLMVRANTKSVTPIAVLPQTVITTTDATTNQLRSGNTLTLTVGSLPSTGKSNDPAYPEPLAGCPYVLSTSAIPDSTVIEQRVYQNNRYFYHKSTDNGVTFSDWRTDTLASAWDTTSSNDPAFPHPNTSLAIDAYDFLYLSSSHIEERVFQANREYTRRSGDAGKTWGAWKTYVMAESWYGYSGSLPPGNHVTSYDIFWQGGNVDYLEELVEQGIVYNRQVEFDGGTDSLVFVNDHPWIIKFVGPTPTPPSCLNDAPRVPTATPKPTPTPILTTSGNSLPSTGKSNDPLYPAPKFDQLYIYSTSPIPNTSQIEQRVYQGARYFYNTTANNGVSWSDWYTNTLASAWDSTTSNNASFPHPTTTMALDAYDLLYLTTTVADERVYQGNRAYSRRTTDGGKTWGAWYTKTMAEFWATNPGTPPPGNKISFYDLVKVNDTTYKEVVIEQGVTYSHLLTYSPTIINFTGATAWTK